MLIYKTWGIKWNIDYQTLDSTYLWCECQEIWKTNIIYSLLYPFEWMHLWQNHGTKWRTNTINIPLWSKIMSLKCYEVIMLKNPCQTKELTEYAGKVS